MKSCVQQRLLEWCSEKTEDDKQKKRPKWVQGGARQIEGGREGEDDDTNTGQEEQWERGEGDRREGKRTDITLSINQH